MKNILFTLLLFSLNCHSESITINKHDLVGSWETHLGYGVKSNPDTRIDYLSISNDYNVSYEMNISNTRKQVIKANNTEFTNTNEFYIVTFNTGKITSFKLVFSGWVNGHDTLIFGMLYLYNNGQLFNGIPVSFRKSS